MLWSPRRARQYLLCAADAAARREGIEASALDRVAALVDREAHLTEASFRIALAAAGWPDFLRDRAVGVVRSEHVLVARARGVDLTTVLVTLLAYIAARCVLPAAAVHLGFLLLGVAYLALRSRKA